jgi:hypothetical protein
MQRIHQIDAKPRQPYEGMIMKGLDRRRFLAMSSAAAVPFFTDLGFLGPLSHMADAAAATKPITVGPNADLVALVKLLRQTPREKCVALFIHQLRDGLSHQQFLSTLFLATLEHGDPHQVAQVYSAHRVSSEVRMEERLLPLFWVLDRIALGFEQEPDRVAPALIGDQATSEVGSVDAVRRAMTQLDPAKAERAVVLLGRTRGTRKALDTLWEYSSRRAAGTLGHHPIMLANSWRTLDALGWQHPEPVLQYLARSFAQSDPDTSYEPNRELVARTLPRLPANWTVGKADRSATLDLYAVLRQGNWRNVCHQICSQLIAKKIAARATWDAIHLAAADLLFRYKTGGSDIGGVLVHAVTATDALRFGFDCTANDRVRLLLLLQAVAMLDEIFITPAKHKNQLRDMNLLELDQLARGQVKTVADVFALLPHKDFLYTQKSPDERQASDEACAGAFGLLQNPATAKQFMQTARGLLCVKASHDPHDMKYPAAAFDDAFAASPEWVPYLLASSVHALHGPRSADSAALVQAREALR